MDVEELRKIEETEAGYRALRWLPYLLFLIVTAILAIPLLKNFSYWGIRDWDLFTTLHAAAVHTVKEYGQFPFWNPWIGGGNILFAHPETPVLHPSFLLLWLLGPLAGLKIQILLIYYLGFIGMFKLARILEINFWAALVPPLVYMLSSYFALHFAEGHIPFHYFAFLPWLVFFYKKSLNNSWHILSIGGVTAFMILGSGAAVPMLFSLFFLFLISLFDINRKKIIRGPAFAVAGGVCGILFSAVKFFPMYDYLSRYPWSPEGTIMTTPLWILPKMFFAFHQSLFSDYIRGYTWGWHEYGAFIGPIAALLILAALAIRFKRNWPYLALIIISIILLAGSFASWSPWDLLHKLPGFESVRVPSRLSLLAIFAAAILAGKGLDSVMELFQHGKVAIAGVIFAAILGTHLFVCLPILNHIFRRPPLQVVYNKDFKQTYGEPNHLYETFLANRGSIKAAWLSAYRPGRAILDYNDNVLEWYSEDNKVQVLDRDFTPNRIKYYLQSGGGGVLTVSVGYDSGWKRTDGGEILDRGELLSFVIPAGKTELEIYYFPDYFTLGLFISLLSIMGAILAPFLYRTLRK